MGEWPASRAALPSAANTHDDGAESTSTQQQQGCPDEPLEGREREAAPGPILRAIGAYGGMACAVWLVGQHALSVGLGAGGWASRGPRYQPSSLPLAAIVLPRFTNPFQSPTKGPANADLDARDEEGTTPLTRACRSLRHLDNVRLLLAAGANVNATDYCKQTALHVCSAWGRLETVQELLRAGADTEASDKFGRTPLHVAVARHELGAVKALLRAGANIEATDKRGETPLHVACREGLIATVQELLNSGANTDAKNETGQTPLDAARFHDNADIVALLLLERRASGGETK
ncbi:hypothetical protein GPECTOR_5g157 [Gonium pectorale]|uniref:Uncharacterized protein n=1 Tax=Gonium pectorale TaxID=33097 RepID=A0A150GWJ6_GONPE|nr:hypothetical protein GPECTOR_5g157 [Gonium pectorale]|eukprot:KXZ54048.1 hypothetical protein GPECTOR_5g157 [Gonium pectorale]